MHTYTFAVACILQLAYGVAVASATVLLPADFTTVVSESTLIVHGRVIAVRSALTGPERVIETFVTVDVLESLKGNAGATVTFRVPNGQVGRHRRIFVGAPEFLEGDEAFLFLRGQVPAVPTVYGLSQGVYRVARDAAARAVVTAPPATSGGGVERVVRGDPARRPMPVAAFASEVHAILERRR